MERDLGAETAGASRARRRALVGSTLALAGAVRLALALVPDPIGDITIYRSWAERIAAVGVNAAYFTPANPAINYPPVVPYLSAFMYAVQRATGFVLRSDPAYTVDVLLRLPATAADALLAWLIFGIVRPRHGFWIGWLAMAAYAFNPGIVLNTGYWGQTDAIHCLLLLLALMAVDRGRPEVAWSAFAVAAFTKPLVWPLAPILLLVTLRDCSVARILRSAAAAIASALVLLSPFVAGGHVLAILRRTVTGTDVMPFLSANGHNLWWLVSLGRPEVPSSRFYDLLSAALYGAFLLLLLARFRKARGLEAYAFVTATAAYGFFMLATHMHENHLFTVFPFLAIAWPRDRRLGRLYALASVPLLLNIGLHDPAVFYPMQAWLERTSGIGFWPVFRGLTCANAALNLALFLSLAGHALTSESLRGDPGPRSGAATS